MRRYLFSLLLLQLLVLSAHAQLNFYARGGVAVPVLPDAFKNYWNMGVGFEAGLGGVILGEMEVVASVEYERFGLDKGATLNGLDASAEVSGGDVSMLGGHVHTVVRLQDIDEGGLSPFVEGGLGVMRFLVDDLDVRIGDLRESTERSSNIAVMGFAGFGVLFSTGSAINPFMSVRAAYLLDDGEDEVFFPVKAGLMIRLTH